MNQRTAAPPGDVGGEVAALIATLQRTQQCLDMLTEGEVDTVADTEGRTFLLGRAQERMRHSEAARQAAILNALPANIALLDTQGVIVSVNDAWRNFAVANVPQGPGQGIGLNYLQICDSARGDHAAEARQAAAGLRSVLDGTQSYFSLEYPCHSPSEQRWFQMTVTPLSGENRNGAVIMHLDITQRRRTDEESRRFASAMDAASDAIYLVDRASMQFVHVNDAACRMRKQTRDELLALGPAGVLSISRAELEKTYDALIASGVDAIPVELQRQRKDGSQVWLDMRRHALRMENGWTIVTLVRDITERKLAVQELNRSESRFRNLTMLSSDWFWEQDENHRFVRFSGGDSVDGWGPDQSKAVGLHRWDLGGAVPISCTWEEHKEILDTHRPFRNFEYKRTLDSGALQYVAASGEPVFDDGGRFSGYRGVATEITKRKEAEVRIKRLNRVHSLQSGINTAIVRNQTREALFSEVCRIAVAEGQFTAARVVELDLNGKARIAATSAFDSGEFQKIVDEYNANPEFSQTLLALGLRDGKPLISNDVATDLRMPNRVALTRDGTFAFALLPIIVNKRVAGALTLRARDAGMFDEAELKLLVEVVANLSFALEHMEGESKVRRLTRVYAVLSGINTLIVRTISRDELFREACRIAVESGGFLKAWLGTVNGSPKQFRMAAAHGGDPAFFQSLEKGLNEKFLAGDGLVARALATLQPVISNDARGDPEVLMKDSAIASGVRSIALLPLVVAGEAVGVFTLNADSPEYFDEEEIKLLVELAGDIAFAIDHIDKRDRLEYLAYYDALTGLANRSLLLERVAQYMRSAVSGGEKLALFVLDLERFRHINDSLGRPAGDAILKQVADFLSHGLGDPNLLARLGADQFAIVLPVITQVGILEHLLEKRIRLFLEHSFRVNDSGIRIGVKVGGAVFPKDGIDAPTLLRNAEVALKMAKRRGDPYLFYKSKMTEATAGILSLENQLREALDKEEFVLHYQPKINHDSGELTSAEALIRWNDPRTGLVPPGKFIPVLEETGLIQDVGRWALRKAVEDYLRWRAAGLPAVRIAVNVSPLQLRNRGFVEEIRKVVSVDCHAAEGLELEITESLIMEDVEHNIASLQAIRALGVTIAIDDFGTGFSSLSYLAKLPVDTLKIDRSFVNDMTLSPQGLSLVSTVITLAHSLKLKVVAEGVETEEQSRLLRLLRCDEMQGFLFSKPLPVGVFEEKFLAPSTRT